jgi:hypothetical protein
MGDTHIAELAEGSQETVRIERSGTCERWRDNYIITTIHVQYNEFLKKRLKQFFDILLIILF